MTKPAGLPPAPKRLAACRQFIKCFQSNSGKEMELLRNRLFKKTYLRKALTFSSLIIIISHSSCGISHDVAKDLQSSNSANLIQGNHHSKEPPAIKKDDIVIEEKSIAQAPLNPRLPDSAKVVCYANTTVTPPENSKLFKGAQAIVALNDDNLLDDLACPDDGNMSSEGLHVYFKHPNNNFFEIYTHGALYGDGGTAGHCTYSYNLQNIHFSTNDEILSYQITQNSKCDMKDYDRYDNVIGYDVYFEKSITQVIIDTYAHAILAEYITAKYAQVEDRYYEMQDIQLSHPEPEYTCELDIKNNSWVYKCSNEENNSTQNYLDGGYYQGNFCTYPYSRYEDCIKKFEHDRTNY